MALKTTMLALLWMAAAAPDNQRAELWIDLIRGEPTALEWMLDDLQQVDVIYVGERHRIERHHRIQAELITALAQRGKRLVVAMEQLESPHQGAIDRFNRGELDFDQLAETIEWEKQWRGYQQYRPIVETARRHDVPILAINAPRELIRAVARHGGVDAMPSEARAKLPEEIQTDDPAYAQWLNTVMMVHASVDEATLRPMREAQIARDEHMAETLTEYLASPKGQGRIAVVICGAGHMNYGLGMPDRVERRMPQVSQRLILMSESGDLELTEAEKAAARPITITHDDLRAIGRPIADYLHVAQRAPEETDDRPQESPPVNP